MPPPPGHPPIAIVTRKVILRYRKAPPCLSPGTGGTRGGYPITKKRIFKEREIPYRVISSIVATSMSISSSVL